MTVSAEALEAAARWYVALQDVDADEATRAGWGRWLDADARHRQAWARMLDLQERLGSVPGDVLLPTLQAARQQQRRRLLALALLAGGGAALGLYSTPPWRVLTAGLRTATGERRTVTLPDGGRLYLNTGSAVDVDYGSERRLLRLYQGEVLVQTAPDNAGRRPFEVLTSDGSVRALGTRFSVRRDEDATRVAVFQDAVLLQPADPGAAPLRLSGAFRLADTDAVLENVAASLPVALRTRTRYWVRVVPR